MPKKKVHKGQLEISASKSVKKSDAVKRPVKKKKRKGISFREDKPPRGWMICGFDVSMSSIAGAAISYDAVLKKFKGPVFAEIRWSKEDHYFDRLKAAAKSHDLILDMQGQMLLTLGHDEIFIAEEEPWPFGLARKGDSQWLKQQAEVSGAFLGGLVRYGFENVTQMNSIRWRTIVANGISEDLGEDVTTHFSKWKSPKLCDRYNCAPKDSGKFRTKQWALDVMAPYFGQQWETEIPDWPDIIENTKLGKIPRPEDSKAKAVQPDDRYDALAIAWTHYLELEESRLIAIHS